MLGGKRYPFLISFFFKDTKEKMSTLNSWVETLGRVCGQAGDDTAELKEKLMSEARWQTREAAATQITSVCSSAITCHIHSLLKDHHSLQVLRCQRKSTFWGNVICPEELLTLIKIALRHYGSLGTHSAKGSWNPGREGKAIWDPQKPGRPGALRGLWEGLGYIEIPWDWTKIFRPLWNFVGE